MSTDECQWLNQVTETSSEIEFSFIESSSKEKKFFSVREKKTFQDLGFRTSFFSTIFKSKFVHLFKCVCKIPQSCSSSDVYVLGNHTPDMSSHHHSQSAKIRFQFD